MRCALIVVITFLFSCRSEPHVTISKEAAANLFLDITLSDQIINLHSPEDRDSIRELLTQNLLKIHNVSQEELDENLHLYMSDFDKFGDLTDVMMMKYDSLEKLANERELNEKKTDE